MQRKSVGVMALAAVCASIVAGCGNGDADGGSAGPAPTAGNTATSAPAGDPRREQVGTVETVIARLARINGAQVNSRSSLAAGDLVATDSEGELDFSLEEKIKKCRTLPGSELRVQPGGGVLVDWTAGSSLCVTTDDPSPRTFTAGGVQLRAADPTFEVKIDGAGTLVRVMHGFVEVGRGEATVMVGPQQETRVPKGRPPPEPGRATRMTANETAALRAIEGLQPAPVFERPAPGDSRGLSRSFDRRRLLVAVDGRSPDSRRVVAFAEAYFRFLSESWKLNDPEVTVASSDGALRGLREGTLDVFVTAGDSGRLPSFPFVDRNGRILRAVVADDRYREALEGFTAKALNSGDYGRQYEGVFGDLPVYKVFQPLLFRS